LFAVCVAQNIAQFVRSDILEAGWRRSADRAVLPLNSLQTGNFSGKIRIFRLYERLITAKMAALQGLLKKLCAALRSPCGIETAGARLPIGRERPIRFWWHVTPLKNLVHGLLRT